MAATSTSASRKLSSNCCTCARWAAELYPSISCSAADSSADSSAAFVSSAEWESVALAKASVATVAAAAASWILDEPESSCVMACACLAFACLALADEV